MHSTDELSTAGCQCRQRLASVVSILLAGLLAGCARASDPAWARPPAHHPGEPTIVGAPLAVPRFAQPPILDGKLDDAAWAHAAVLGPFGNPMDGREVADDDPVAAFARLGWDAERLYFALVVHDRAATSPFSRDEEDPHIWSRASGIELMLQPGDPGDNRDYYEIQVDAAGALFDTHWDDYNIPITGDGPARRYGHLEWSSRLERAVHVDRRFYVVEAALPWAVLVAGRVAIPPRPGDVWRLNFYSFRDGQRRALAWSPLRGQGNFHRASRFGRIQFE
jgi:hypothetical protein